MLDHARLLAGILMKPDKKSWQSAEQALEFDKYLFFSFDIQVPGLIMHDLCTLFKKKKKKWPW